MCTKVCCCHRVGSSGEHGLPECVSRVCCVVCAATLSIASFRSTRRTVHCCTATAEAWCSRRTVHSTQACTPTSPPPDWQVCSCRVPCAPCLCNRCCSQLDSVDCRPCRRCSLVCVRHVYRRVGRAWTEASSGGAGSSAAAHTPVAENRWHQAVHINSHTIAAEGAALSSAADRQSALQRLQTDEMWCPVRGAAHCCGLSIVAERCAELFALMDPEAFFVLSVPLPGTVGGPLASRFEPVRHDSWTSGSCLPHSLSLSLSRGCLSLSLSLSLCLSLSVSRALSLLLSLSF